MNADTARKYGRWIGVLYVITIIAGGWGEAHVPNTLLLADDVVGTAHKVASSVGLFRASFVAYLVEAVCDITLNVLLYALLRPVIPFSQLPGASLYWLCAADLRWIGRVQLVASV
jgi:hypothetical protein